MKTEIHKIFATQALMIEAREALEAAGYVPREIGCMRRGEEYISLHIGSWRNSTRESAGQIFQLPDQCASMTTSDYGKTWQYA